MYKEMSAVLLTLSVNWSCLAADSHTSQQSDAVWDAIKGHLEKPRLAHP